MSQVLLNLVVGSTAVNRDASNWRTPVPNRIARPANQSKIHVLRLPVSVMRIDLFLAFRERPPDIRDQLVSRRFVLACPTTSAEEGEPEDVVYRYKAHGVSAQGVWAYYRAPPIEEDFDMWTMMAPGRPLAAMARLTTYEGHNGFDELVQYLTARTLRDQYDALLFDGCDAEMLFD